MGLHFPKIRFDSHTLGNLIKNVSPAAGLIGGPAGIALAGGLSALGDKARGKDISLKNALTNATLAGGVGSIKGALASHGAAPVAAGAPAAPVPTGGLPLPSTPTLTSISEQAVDPRNLVTKALDAGKGIAGWAADHPNAAAGALQGIGNLATAGATNKAANAQADLLQKQADETEYDFMKRKQRDQALAPVWSALGDSVGSTYNGVAKNPYAPPGVNL